MRSDLYQDLFDKEDSYWWHIAKRGLVRQLLPAKKHLRILDIGCGAGRLIQELGPVGEVWGIDSNPAAIAFCRRRGLKNVFQAKLPYINIKPRFDVITCMDVLEHVDDDTRAVGNLKKLLRPQGIIILTVPAYPWLFSYWDKILHHRRRYTLSGLKQIFTTNKLSILKASFIYSFLLPAVIPFRLIRHQLFTGKKPTSDFITMPKLFHHLLLYLARLEHLLIKFISIPFGLSLLVVARKGMHATTPPGE